MTQTAPSLPDTGTPFFFQRRFFPMWSSFSLGVFTDNMLKQALLIGITFSLISLPAGVSALPGVQTGPDIVPYAGALFALAMVLFSPISGQVADKVETARMFRITKLTEIGLMLVAAYGFMTSNGLLLLLMLFAMGVQSAFYSPVRISAMPKYLHADELVRGNALCSGGLFIANSAAYAVGGGLIQTASGPLIISVILVAVALLGWGAVIFAPRRPPDAPALQINWNIFSQYARMARYVAAEPPVIRPLLGAGIFFFNVTAVTVNVPYFARDILHGDGQVATVIMIGFMLGALIGATAAGALAKGKSGLNFSALALGLAILSMLVLVGISLAAMGNPPADLYSVTEFLGTATAWPVLIAFTAASAFTTMFIIPLQAAIQRRVLPDHRARIMAAGNVLNAGMALMGSLSVLLVTSNLLAPHQLFLFIALIQFATVAYMQHRRRSAPEGLHDEMLKDGT